MSSGPLRPAPLTSLTGEELFEFGLSVRDFWAWALGDLRMNTSRGFLVEFLVAKAVNSPTPFRVEWAPFDVLAADQTRIEVKAAGYLQSWTQARPSTPTYSFSTAYATTFWDEQTGVYADVDPRDRVHVWVFALQTCTDHATYDPMSLSQWEFRVVPHQQLIGTGQKSARLSFFDRLGIAPVAWKDLSATVSAARRRHEALLEENPQ